MNINTIFAALGVSKFKAAWILITKGPSGLMSLLAEAFTTLLSKANPEKLNYYADLSIKLADFTRYGINLFAKDGPYKNAGLTTAVELESFAKHIQDGVYTQDELEDDIACIKNCINLWKEAARGE